MGIVAARTLAARVRGDKTLPKRILLPSTLIERDSVRRMRRSGRRLFSIQP